MELSGKIEYALLALLELTANYPQGEPLQIRQIAAQQDIPDRYLEQLLATLRRGGLTVSQRGAKGGYLLAKEPWQITLLEVVECLEGTDYSRPEVATDTVERAVIEDVWEEITASTRQILQGYTLQDLCEKGDARRQLNLMYYI